MSSISSPSLLDHWYVVATSHEVGETPVALQLLDRRYVAWRTGAGDLVATADRCPHREMPLSDGRIEGDCLRCPYHGWVFDAAGRCVEVPSSGDGAATPPAAHLDTLAIEERYGLVWLCPGEPTGVIPRLRVAEDASFTRLNTGIQMWNCSATRMIDNMLDVAHFPYTHIGTFGREADQVVPHFALTDLDDTFHGYEYAVTIKNEGETKAMSGGGADVITITMSTGFAMPFSVRSTMSYDNGIEQTLFMTAAPMSVDRSYYTFVLWRNDDVSETGQQIVDFELEVVREDREMLERLRGELTLDRGGLVDVQSDKASVEWRRRYREMVTRQ